MMRQVFTGLVAVSIVGLVGYGLMRGPMGGALEGKPLEKQVSALKAAAAKAPKADPSDAASVRALATALGPVATVTIGGFDGATATDVEIRPAAFDSVGVTIEALDVYGADADAVTAALDGGEWEQLYIAERLDARGIATFGLAEMLTSMMSDIAGSMPVASGEGGSEVPFPLEEGAEDGGDEGGSEVPFPRGNAEDGGEGEGGSEVPFPRGEAEDGGDEGGSEVPFPAEGGMPTVIYSRYDVSMDRLVIDGMTLYAPDVTVADDAGDVWKMVAKIADWQRRYSFDLAATEGLRSVTVTQTPMFDGTTAESSTELMLSFTGYHGAFRGDTNVAVVEGMTMTMDMPVGQDDVPPLTIGMDIGLFGVDSLRFSDVMASLAGGSIPATDDTDILSYGHWRAEGIQMSANGAEVMGMKTTEVDLREFHWLLPEKISYGFEDLSIGLGNIFDLAQEMGGDDIPEEVSVRMAQALGILEAHDSDTPTFDHKFSLTWSPENGETAMSSKTHFEGYGKEIQKIDGMLPNFETLVSSVSMGEDGPDASELVTALQQDAALGRFEYTLADSGGLEKLASMAKAIATLMEAEGNQQAAQVASQTPQALRQMVSGLMFAASTQAGAILPEAPKYVQAVANYVVLGGTITILIEPEEPITAATLAEFDMASPAAIPAIVDRLGFSVVHVAPESEDEDSADDAEAATSDED